MRHRQGEVIQRAAITLEQVADYANLLRATWKAARGKRTRPAVERFLADLDTHLERLAEGILAGEVPDGHSQRFVIHDPKRRVITAACFADRVLHHAIMSVAEPRLERALVDTCYACRPGRGVHAAVVAVQGHLRRWPWYVQVDVDGYFPSIDHQRLKALLARRFKGDQFLALLGRIIDTGATNVPERGLPIGTLTSQHFANAYLDGADRWLVGHRGVRAHVRYMDDIVRWCDSRRESKAVLEGLGRYLWEERSLRLKAGAHIGLTRDGIAYCGFRIRPGVVLASSRKLSRYRAGLARLARAEGDASVDETSLQRAADSLLATLAGAQTVGFRRRLLASAGVHDSDAVLR